MKTRFICFFLILTMMGFSFTQEQTENSQSDIKTPEELQREVLKNE